MAWSQGWQADAYSFASPNYDMTSFVADYNLPSAPSNYEGQTIYYFIGCAYSHTSNPLLQPVLLYGPAPSPLSGGGQYWSLFSCYVDTMGVGYVSSLVTVTGSPSSVTGRIEKTNNGPLGAPCYTISFDGYSGTVKNTPVLTGGGGSFPKVHGCYVVAEQYGYSSGFVDNCTSDFVASITDMSYFNSFTSTQVNHATLSWSTEQWGDNSSTATVTNGGTATPTVTIHSPTS